MYARKVDTTHKEIRDGLREAGFSVMDVRGDFDILAGKHGIDLKIECKTLGNVRVNSRTGKKQEALRAEWKGDPLVTAYCLEDALYAFRMRLKQRGWVK